MLCHFSSEKSVCEDCRDSSCEVVLHHRAECGYSTEVIRHATGRAVGQRGVEVEVGKGKAYQMKSVQWLQKVGCLKKRAMNLWFLISWTFFCLKAPLRANLFATSAVDDSFELTSAMSPLSRTGSTLQQQSRCVGVFFGPCRGAALSAEPAECGAAVFTGDTARTV